ncbi:MAG: hypothetical protein NTW68_05280 [candidate division NC10 bacterium]|nr:hypothetical protein [candidate division NC10 bacterium]
MPLAERSHRVQAALRPERVVVRPSDKASRVPGAQPQKLLDFLTEDDTGGPRLDAVHRLDYAGESSRLHLRPAVRRRIFRRPEQAQSGSERGFVEAGVHDPTRRRRPAWNG